MFAYIRHAVQNVGDSTLGALLSVVVPPLISVGVPVLILGHMSTFITTWR